MPSLNLGILAHVDAGKTTLTERLLFEAGVLDHPGSVDAGTTRTNSMDLERRRGITIRSAVTTFAVGDLTVNLVDTPGHPDFIAEVERALDVLDGAVLVVSAVEGVQPQTVVIWRALERLGVPTLVFVNKVDRAGADPHRVAAEVASRLTSRSVSLVGAGPGWPVEALAAYDDGLLDAWVAGDPVPADRAAAVARRAVAEAALVPVLAGSARTGDGVGALTDAIVDWLPPVPDHPGTAAAGVVFKIERDDHGKRVYLRMRGGQVRVRERVSLAGRAAERVTGLWVSAPDGFVETDSVGAGRIALVRGLESARIGDTLGAAGSRTALRFPTPALETVVTTDEPADRPAMFAALAELAEQDPLIALHTDAAEGGLAVRLYGEVQKEVIGALLAEQYGIRVRFAPSSVVCVERLVGTGAAVDRIGVGDNPYLATVGLRVGPAPVGSGLRFSLDVEAGAMPAAFFAATEEGVREGLRQGLHGWAVPDCTVAMTHSGYYPRQSRMHQKFDKSMSSVAADFRRLAPVVLMAAIARARTQVCEPVDRVTVELPRDCVDQLVALVSRRGGVLVATDYGPAYCRVSAHLPAARVREVGAALPDLTGGAGVLVTEPDHFRPVRGRPPERRRVGPDPLDRPTWFRAMPR